MPLVLEEKRDPLYKKGIIQGKVEGKAEGRKEGQRNGKLESAYIMVTKYNLPIAKITKDFGLEESELINYIDTKINK